MKIDFAIVSSLPMTSMFSPGAVTRFTTKDCPTAKLLPTMSPNSSALATSGLALSNSMS